MSCQHTPSPRLVERCLHFRVQYKHVGVDMQSVPLNRLTCANFLFLILNWCMHPYCWNEQMNASWRKSTPSYCPSYVRSFRIWSFFESFQKAADSAAFDRRWRTFWMCCFVSTSLLFDVASKFIRLRTRVPCRSNSKNLQRKKANFWVLSRVESVLSPRDS